MKFFCCSMDWNMKIPAAATDAADDAADDATAAAAAASVDIARIWHI